ncbi:cytochrome P450 [Polymorphobacter megasporae]|uniref:cytochrome P450 n=1 Tax=Glacieibacterium megasporae TaxID=2835787 RepID=UPI001C1E4401|nr:cytochrome P450 [Polymorphobacter megasporae]UAJ09706.1 cytochrome P450 [Polymorphobacter megasporae]
MDKVYALPWLRRRVEITSEPERIERYVKKKFTRSSVLMALLSAFHLSRDSILVSSDEHAAFMRGMLLKCFPAAADYPSIAVELVERLFDKAVYATCEHRVTIAPVAVRSLYVTLLETLLGAFVPPNIRDFIDSTNFSPGWRPLRVEAFMYSFRLHLPIFAPIRWLLDLGLFRQARRMRHLARKLEQMLEASAEPRPGSWLEALQHQRNAGTITEKQFRGELTAILVSTFSLASTLSFCLLCLAATPWYVGKINRDPEFAKIFLYEVLRLYPPFHQFGYRTLHDDGSEGSAEFLISALFLHRNPKHWEMPDNFYPERFQEPASHSRFRYLPFGIGARLCPGRSYSLRLLIEVLKVVCADSSPVTLMPSDRMPMATADRVISFPREGLLTFQVKPR